MNNPISRPLGEYLRARRRSLGLSTNEVARRSGINRAQVVRLENGTSAHPAPETLRGMAAALDLALSDVWAMAGFKEASQLPAPLPYLRAKYQDMPEKDIQALTRDVALVLARHGISGSARPTPGEDETPEQD